MEFNHEAFLKDRDQSKQEDEAPKASVVEDKDNLTEDDLKREFLVNGDEKKPVREGTGTGGENFGNNNLTPSANDKNNPSQYAGNSNAYFDRTEPSEEHPENSNFKPENPAGSPDYDEAQPARANTATEPKPEKVERGNGENDRPHKGNTYEEGTADNDEPNIPGPNELPDQQKVGEDVDPDDDRHIET